MLLWTASCNVEWVAFITESCYCPCPVNVKLAKSSFRKQWQYVEWEDSKVHVQIPVRRAGLVYMYFDLIFSLFLPGFWLLSFCSACSKRMHCLTPSLNIFNKYWEFWLEFWKSKTPKIEYLAIWPSIPLCECFCRSDLACSARNLGAWWLLSFLITSDDDDW